MSAAPEATLLEAEVLRALRAEWRRWNEWLFDGRLRAPLIELSDAEHQLGLWTSKDRTLRVARRLVRGHVWVTVVEILKHEMAHQYVVEVLGRTDETAHGDTFRRVCLERGIDADASGLPTTDAPEPRLLRKIRSLLSLATSANEHEAHAAARKAYQLMLRHNVDQAALGGGPRFVARQLGGVQKRRPTHEKLLASLLGSHFFVAPMTIPAFDVEAGSSGWTFEISGSPENVDLAEYVWTWTLGVGEALWREHKVRASIRGDRDRRQFLTGLVTGFSRQLRAEQDACAETGLVWLGDPALSEWHRARYPKVRRRSTSYRTGDAWAAGVSEGQKLRLRRPIQSSDGGPIGQIG